MHKYACTNTRASLSSVAVQETWKKIVKETFKREKAIVQGVCDTCALHPAID